MTSGEWRAERGAVRQRDERFEPVADDVGVRQFVFVRQNFPGRIE